MSKSDRLAHIIEVYLEGDLELNTAVAELVHVYIVRGWRFSLVTAECEPRFRSRMRALALRVDAAILARREATGRAPDAIPPIIIR
ncbi:MAG TPA: hypothetical protein VIM84_02215 [Gemmatimonadales bacterium]